MHVPLPFVFLVGLVFIFLSYSLDSYISTVAYYELSLAHIASDLQINYALQQQTLDALTECK